jgi:hypothetical protein
VRLWHWGLRTLHRLPSFSYLNELVYLTSSCRRLGNSLAGYIKPVAGYILRTACGWLHPACAWQTSAEECAGHFSEYNLRSKDLEARVGNTGNTTTRFKYRARVVLIMQPSFVIWLCLIGLFSRIVSGQCAINWPFLVDSAVCAVDPIGDTSVEFQVLPNFGGCGGGNPVVPP